jgi:adenylate cyclase, class 2
MQNLELKARLADLSTARDTATTLATDRLGVQHQVDTYFQCPHGRLKLREIDGYHVELIAYQRPDQLGPKASNYQRVLIAEAEAESLKKALTGTLGIRCVVQKRREIFLLHNIRIHLDEVNGLGSFLEFEAVLDSPDQEAAARAQLVVLLTHFGLQQGDLLSGSYGEML